MTESMMASISLLEYLRMDAVCKAAKTLVDSVEPSLEPDIERVSEKALTALETILEAAGYGADYGREPEEDGECFCNEGEKR